MLKVLAETWDEYMRTLNGALDLKRTARDGMNIEEPGLDTYKVGTVEAPSGGAVNMHTIERQVAVITGPPAASDMPWLWTWHAAGQPPWRWSISVTGLCRWPAK